LFQTPRTTRRSLRLGSSGCSITALCNSSNQLSAQCCVKRCTIRNTRHASMWRTSMTQRHVPQ
jgi:hypothetical protein